MFGYRLGLGSGQGQGTVLEKGKRGLGSGLVISFRVQVRVHFWV